MPLSLMDHTACPGLELLSCESLAIPFHSCSCCCCWSIAKCTQATGIMEIIHGVPGHFSCNTYRLPVYNQRLESNVHRLEMATFLRIFRHDGPHPNLLISLPLPLELRSLSPLRPLHSKTSQTVLSKQSSLSPSLCLQPYQCN
jgi:hypothetical protein